MLRALSAYESPIVPKHLLEGTDIKSAKLGNNPVGTGPFKFVEWKKGQYVRLDKNKNYWRPGLPYLDRVVGRFVPDASTRTAAMENGEVLYAAYNAVPNIDAVRPKERDDISVITQVCDRVAVMRQGEVVETGSTSELFSSPKHDYTQALLAAVPGKTWQEGILAN